MSISRPSLRLTGQIWRVGLRTTHFNKLPGDPDIHWGWRTTGLQGPTDEDCCCLSDFISFAFSLDDSTPAPLAPGPLHWLFSFCLDHSFPRLSAWLSLSPHSGLCSIVPSLLCHSRQTCLKWSPYWPIPSPSVFFCNMDHQLTYYFIDNVYCLSTPAAYK